MSDQGKTKIVILHNPNPMHTQQENTKAYLKIIGQLSDFCKVFNYYFKFGSGLCESCDSNRNQVGSNCDDCLHPEW